MAEKQFKNIVNALNDFFIGEGLILNKILLFGSFSKGTEHEESDMDLIVVSESFRRKNIFQISKMVGGIDWALVKKSDRPLDILYYSDTDWEKGNSLIINAAKQDGIVLYG